jgi:hypothetical protein
MFTSFGWLKEFREDGSYKLIVEVDPEISNYYRALIPKYCRAKPQRYAPHISVIRHENPYDPERWEFSGPVEFQYDGVIYDNGIYFWLAVECRELEKIRQWLFLPPVSEITRSPDGRHKFHITLGNTK